MMKDIVTVISDGVTEMHAGSGMGVDYATMCGLDGDDPNPAVAQSIVETPKGAKINCYACYQIFMSAKRFRASDFKVKP